MQNKSIIWPVIVLTVFFGICAHPACAGTEINNAGTAALSDSAYPDTGSDLQEVENTIRAVEESLAERQYEQNAKAGRSKLQEAEMNRWRVLKADVKKLRDDVNTLSAKSKKLMADRKKSREALEERVEASRVIEEKIKAVTDRIVAGDKESKDASTAAGAESVARKEKIDSLKTELKSSTENLASLRSKKAALDGESDAQEIEYKAETKKYNALKNKPASTGKDGASPESALAASKKKIDDYMAKAAEREDARKKLTDEILASSEANKMKEEAISALEGEGALSEKALEARSRSLKKEKKAADIKMKKLNSEALAAKSKQASAAAALKKIEDELKKNVDKELIAEKELGSKIEDLKLRISAFVGKLEQDGAFVKFDEKARAKEGLSKGEQISSDINIMFDALKKENDRLMAENKAIKTSMERTEADLKESRRKAVEAAKKPEALRVKMEKERLDMHYNLAIVYEKNGLYVEAEKEYLKCLKIDPKDPGVHYNLGILYDDKLNENDKAREQYWEFLKYRPMGDTAERVRDWITKLELEKRLGKEMR